MVGSCRRAADLSLDNARVNRDVATRTEVGSVESDTMGGTTIRRLIGHRDFTASVQRFVIQQPMFSVFQFYRLKQTKSSMSGMPLRFDYDQPVFVDSDTVKPIRSVAPRHELIAFCDVSSRKVRFVGSKCTREIVGGFVWFAEQCNCGLARLPTFNLIVVPVHGGVEAKHPIHKRRPDQK